MKIILSETRSLSSFAVLVAIAMTIGIVVWNLIDLRQAPNSAFGRITIVPGSARAASPGSPADVPANVPSISLQSYEGRSATLLSAVSQRYPILKGVELRCDGRTCLLSGNIDPPETDAQKDQRQDMLLGGLETLLKEQGGVVAAPIQMDELGDETYRIRVAFE